MKWHGLRILDEQLAAAIRPLTAHDLQNAVRSSAEADLTVVDAGGLMQLLTVASAQLLLHGLLGCIVASTGSLPVVMALADHG